MWGPPRTQGELLKLGIEIAESTVSKYLVRGRRPPSQTWRTFLADHISGMVPVEFFTVPTVRFQVLYVFLVLAHDRRRIVQVGVTRHPTAEWTFSNSARHSLGHGAAISPARPLPHL
jgi:hypothetical protein